MTESSPYNGGALAALEQRVTELSERTHQAVRDGGVLLDEFRKLRENVRRIVGGLTKQQVGLTLAVSDLSRLIDERLPPKKARRKARRRR